MKCTKRLAFSITGTLVLILLAGGMWLLQIPKLDTSRITQLQITALPSPPKTKQVTQAQDIKKLVQTFNTLQLTPTLAISAPAGTSIWIQITENGHTYQISMAGSTVRINAVSYRCNVDAAMQFRKLYQGLPYKETTD